MPYTINHKGENTQLAKAGQKALCTTVKGGWRTQTLDLQVMSQCFILPGHATLILCLQFSFDNVKSILGMN